MASRVAIGCQDVRIPLACNNGSDNPHAGRARDIRDLVGMEACGTAHHWAREVSKLGHTVRLMPPSYVKGYVKRTKNDAADAAAICEAVTRPSMRFVPIKSADQQALLMLHRTRDLLIRQRTQ